MADKKSKRIISGSDSLSGDEEIPHLPVELVTSILLKLPAKLLLCCRRVCKVWCNIIDSPSFANTHLTSYVPKESELVFLKYRRDTMKVYSLKADNLNYTVNRSRYPITEFVNPYPTTDNYSSYYSDSVSNYIGYGLFLFRSSSCQEKVFLYNPLREEVLMLPRPPAPTDQSLFEFEYENVVPVDTFCLGFDNATNEYKIVHTYNAKGRGSSYESVSKSVVTEICTLGTSTWRKITAVPPVIPDAEAVPAHGDIHWRIVTNTFSPVYNIDEEEVLSFDVKKEEYKLTALPKFHKDYCGMVTLFNIKELLAVHDGAYKRDCDIWILKDYENQEWVKQYTINSSLNVLGSWQDGVILFSGLSYSELLYYDPETDGLTTMVSSSKSYDGTIVIIATSLIALKNYGDLMAKRVSRRRGTFCFNLSKANT